MLAELSVENLLLIEQARIRLCDGLNVLTGETGAGKTVLAHALDLLLGGRARQGIVRPGTAEAYVEGVFSVSPERMRDAGELFELLGGDACEVGRGTARGGDPLEVLLARRVGADGRTRAYVNGRSVTVAQLRDLGARLISFYGQHEHRKLTLTAAQLEILDGLCGPAQGRELRACAAAFALVGQLEERSARLHELCAARGRELDLLDHELAEIEAARVDEHEHERLLAERERLRRSDALCSAAGAGWEALAPEASELPGAAQAMAGAAARLEAVAGVDGALDALTERLHALVIETQDLAGELRAYAGGLAMGAQSSAETSLEQLEERLDAVERLMRKHAGGPREVLEYAARARARREELAGADVALAQVVGELESARARLAEHAATLSAARRAAAKRLAAGVRTRLGALAMPDATFDVALTERAIGPDGADVADFVIAPNPGVPAGPLREIASGGELSRVMLAIMSDANASSDSTIVFDEVDAGIGGQTARAVGASLCELARSRQLICITHLAQIASLADRHFAIVKDTSVATTRASVVQLDDSEVEGELVRMLGADATDAGARRHARELLRAA